MSTKHAGRPGRTRPGWRWIMWSGAALLLLVPLVAMRFTSEVDWDAVDFAVMAVLLALVCGGFDLVTRVSRNTAVRLAAGVALVVAFLLVWIELAVGIVGR